MVKLPLPLTSAWLPLALILIFVPPMARSVIICRIRGIANNGLGGRSHTTAIMAAKISTPMMMFFTVDFITILFVIVTILVFYWTME